MESMESSSYAEAWNEYWGLLELAYDAQKSKDFEQSSELLRQALSVFDQDYIGFVRLMEVYEELGDSAAAFDTLRDGLNRVHDEGYKAALRGRVLRTMGKEEEALLAYRDACAAHPDLPATNASLGWLLQRLGYDEESVKHLEKATQLSHGSPDEADVLYSLSVAYIRVGRLDDAEKVLQRAFRANPDSPEVRNGLTWCARKKGNWITALRYKFRL